MNIRRVKQTLLRLSPEEKVISLACIAVMASTLMPWYSIALLSSKSTTLSGFDGSIGVIGFVTFLFSALTLGVVITSHFKIKLPSPGYTKEQISLFLMGESTFLLLMSIAMYARESLQYSNSEIRFGLFTAAASAFFGTFAAFAQIQKKEKKNVESFFAHEEVAEEAEVEAPVEQEINLEAEYPPIKSAEPIVEKVVEKPIEQEKFFYAEEAENETQEVEEVSQEADEEEIVEDETVEEVEIDETPESDEQEIYEEVATTTTQPSKKVSKDQKDFFAREAGIKIDIENVKRVEKEADLPESKPKVSENASFYDDL